jgi:hypothetical protein
VDPLTLPRKVTMDQSRQAWFVIRRGSPMDPKLQSAHNLFYLLSSLIR